MQGCNLREPQKAASPSHLHCGDQRPEAVAHGPGAQNHMASQFLVCVFSKRRNRTPCGNHWGSAGPTF
eukprot:1391148-Amorphochlora_amoeboformis.AAC.2